VGGRGGSRLNQSAVSAVLVSTSKLLLLNFAIIMIARFSGGTPEALKSGGLKVHLSLAEFPPNGVRQQSASTVLITQHVRELPCAGLVGSNT